MSLQTACISSAERQAHSVCERSISVPSPDGCWIARAGAEHTVEIWKGEQKHWSTYYGHQAGVYNRKNAAIVEITWVDERVISRSTDGSIHLWAAPSALHLRTLKEAEIVK